MSSQPGKFRRLLTKAVHQIASQEEKSIQVVQDELGHALGRNNGSCIDYWRRGHVPAHLDDIDTLAREIARRHGLPPADLADFILSAEPLYPQDRLEALLASRTTNVLPPPLIVRPEAPFVVGPPITRPAQFFGRERELQRIFGWWRQFPLQNVALVGPKRSGKSSLLYYLQTIHATPPSRLRPGQRQEWLPNAEQYRWVLIDFQDPRLCRQERLLRTILSELDLPAPSPCTLDSFMDVISHRLRQPAIILMDELIAGLEAPELDEAFWWSLRALISHYADGYLAFVLTAHDFPMKLAEYQGKPSPFFNMFNTVAIGPLMEEEARELIDSSPIPFPEADVVWILEKSGRWPALLQILCQTRLSNLEGAGRQKDDWQAEGEQQIARFSYLLQ